MLASVGTFPVSVLVAGLIVHGLGAALFFPLTAATIAAAILIGLSQPAWRNFGVPAPQPTRPAGNGPATADTAPTRQTAGHPA
jgi:hypothetical protein